MKYLKVLQATKMSLKIKNFVDFFSSIIFSYTYITKSKFFKGDKSDEVGPIEEDKKEVRQMPFSLPASFEWDTLDLSDDSQVVEVYKLLNENYVEDEDNMFRFDYSSEFLQWALRPPG